MAIEEDELDRSIRQAFIRFGPDAVNQATIRSIGAAAKRPEPAEHDRHEAALKEELRRILTTH